MKRIYIFFIVLAAALMISCKSSENVAVFGGGNINVSSVKKMSVDTFTIIQVDSMIRVDKLPQLKKWNSSKLTDQETGRPYIYSTLLDNSSNIIYTVKTLGTNEIYVVMKRRIGTTK